MATAIFLGSETGRRCARVNWPLKKSLSNLLCLDEIHEGDNIGGSHHPNGALGFPHGNKPFLALRVRPSPLQLSTYVQAANFLQAGTCVPKPELVLLFSSR